MTKINVKMDLIRMDMVVKDILRIYEEVPSSYLYPKSELANARALIRSDVKKSLKVAQRARKVFQEESVLASRYNSVRDSIAASGESMRTLNNEYLKQVSLGKYDDASKTLDEICSKMKGSAFDLKVSIILSSFDDGGSMVLIKNPAEFQISITEFAVTKGSEVIRTQPSNTFTVSPKSERNVKVSAVPPFRVAARYTLGGEEHSVTEEL